MDAINGAIASRTDLIVETTISGRGYVDHIRDAQKAGYVVKLCYLRLPDVEASIERVRRRVANRGHDIPELDIRRRFPKSLKNLEDLYLPIVDEWYIWDSIEGDFLPLRAWDMP